MPITISGEARATHTPGEYNGETSGAAGFRAVISPTLKLGAHWFAYSALEAYSSEYFPYQTGLDDDQPVQFQVMQAFLAYTTKLRKASLLIKAGQLTSAFGWFPLEYDDAKMSLIDAPPVYTNNLPLRPDQRPCGVSDIVEQAYGSDIQYGCGGSDVERYGLTPVTLYGLPGVEAELSVSRVDARFQVTNSSPANPHGLTSQSQFLEWATGGGYTFRGGLHVGLSGFRGPYLDKNLSPVLPFGATVRNYSASGLGIDAEWSRGPWSLEGEEQQFRFELPGFITSPSENAAYAQAKRILSPRLFLAVRASAQQFGPIRDSSGASAGHFAGPQQVYELTVGYRLNREQLLKIGGGWTNRNTWSANGWFWPQTESYTFEAQFVTNISAIDKAFR